MKLITDEQRARLLDHGAAAARGEDRDPFPVVKLFTPDAQATWLLTEIDPEDDDMAFGLCDLGLDFPELGYVRISELAVRSGSASSAICISRQSAGFRNMPNWRARTR